MKKYDVVGVVFVHNEKEQKDEQIAVKVRVEANNVAEAMRGFMKNAKTNPGCVASRSGDITPVVEKE